MTYTKHDEWADGLYNSEDVVSPGVADMIAERLSNQPRCVDKCELAGKIGVSVSTIERMMAEKRIRPTKNEIKMADAESRAHW